MANGEVVCSCGDPAGLLVYGNVRNDPIAKIFSSPAYRKMRKYQLDTKPSTYCPVLGCGCGGRTYSATPLHNEKGLHIKRLQLEPVSRCNLDCPECPVHNFALDSRYRPNRKAVLSLSEMVGIVSQLPHLELIWFYNFGEPFLHPHAIEFLRSVKRLNPKIMVHTSTNGIPLTPAKSTVLVDERLLRNIVFSIDGSSQETYGIYRHKGNFARAFANMEFMQSEIQRYGAENEMNLLWQYILFEWNDSDEEIDRTLQLARERGISIKWVLTHTRGHSIRYTHGSQAFTDLIASTESYENLTCELQADDLVHNGVKGGIYQCELYPVSLSLGPGRLSFQVNVLNSSKATWFRQEPNPFRIGVKLLNDEGDVLLELEGKELKADAEAGETVRVDYDLPVTLPPETRFLFLDMVHDGICWFHERGSTPMILDVHAGF